MSTISRNTLVKEFIAAVQEIRRTHYFGTYFWWLNNENDDDNSWAIVLGWSDGFDEEPDDNNADGTWRLCAKVAYQPWNSIMQCDYDVDWEMPYDKITGEVDDNEVPIYPDTDLVEVINWLLDCYHDYNY